MINPTARILVTIATLWYGLVPLFADLNPSHLFNPNWTPHARMHLTWLLSTNFLIAIFALSLLWRTNDLIKSATLGLCVVGGFWIATFSRTAYGGMLVDPDLHQHLVLGVNPNIAANVMMAILLVSGLLIQLRHQRG